MQSSTHREVVRIVSSFIDGIPQIDRSQIEFIRRAYPFHAAIFSEEAILYSKQERSIVTRMGMTLFPTLAKVIALDSHKDVQSNYSIRGTIDAGSLSQIDTIMNELREGGGKRRPNHQKETESIIANRTGKTTEARVIADLYIGDHEEGPVFMEIKSPLPNIDVAAESKKKILIFELMKGKENGRGYLAFAYNPFITREKYAHSFTKAIMDMDEEVLMGVEMWDKIGGTGSYDELIKAVDEAGEEKRKELLGNNTGEGRLN
ncbi:MAG: TdeIII family type II restriction endonuclease [Nitrososphaerota archaeon]|nr:TdeIII family type II restriction endonuclease [Nitrososphaerota archaeon]